MEKIHVMDDILANKIAAGEVVERISSVVKELTENSIDAGSKNIKIELIEAGTRSIKIVDDGCGMSKNDAILCFSRHATSKIRNENDLYFIGTLGFRGEALAAISAVSEVTLDTYDKNESTKVIIEGGKIKSVSEGSKREGTIMEVKKLFYNTPARLKFLKSIYTELANTVSMIEKIALSHPEISFTLINDGKELIKTSSEGNLYKTIHEIYGYNVSKNMIHIEAENYDYKIDGYISNINISKSTRSSMITLVNGRVVSNNLLNRSIKDAYHTILAENRYPIVVLNIEVDLAMVDVNIHPTKQDIKFSKIDSLLDLVFKTIRDKLNESDNTFEGYIEKSDKQIESKYGYEEEKVNISDGVVKEEPVKYESLRLNFDDEEVTLMPKNETTFIKPVGLALGTYLIAQDEDIVYIIDIHAANERINFERYLKALKEKEVYTVDMLFPITIELTKNEYITIKENLDVLTSLGFKIEEFGINTFRITAHPNWLKSGYEEESIRMIFDIICEMNGKFDRIKFCEKTAINLSCKMSVKANTSITVLEQETLINRLFKCEFPYVCPHGRPTIIKYPKYEFEKIFKRVD